MAPTNLEFGPWSLGAPQPCPWESGTEPQTGLPASLPNLTQLQQNYSQQWLQLSLGFSTGKEHLGLRCQTPHTPGGLRGDSAA